MTQAVYCKRHRDTETSITCGRCGDPICPRCLVHAPVGVRCPDCAQSRPVPTFDVSPAFMARGIGAGLGMGLVGGIIGSLIVWFLPIPFLPALVIVGLGYGIGEAISYATNRKRGTRLKIVAGVCMLLAFTIITATTGTGFVTLYWLSGGIAFYVAISRF